MFYKSNSINRVQMQKNTNFDSTWELKETIEILEAQIESLKLELCYKNHELEAMQQELKYINQELGAAINSEQLTYTQAEELARKFLVTEKPIKDILVELLTAIYKVPVKPDVLVQIAEGVTNSLKSLSSKD